MKYTIMLALLLSLQGCMYQQVNSSDWSKAEIVCKNHQGVLNVSSTFHGHENVDCNNGFSRGINGVVTDEPK